MNLRVSRHISDQISTDKNFQSEKTRPKESSLKFLKNILLPKQTTFLDRNNPLYQNFLDEFKSKQTKESPKKVKSVLIEKLEETPTSAITHATNKSSKRTSVSKLQLSIPSFLKCNQPLRKITPNSTRSYDRKSINVSANLTKRASIKTPVNCSESFFKEQIVGIRTRAGYSNSYIRKTNQDSFFSKTDIEKQYSFFGVCDGHGFQGHNVAQFVARFLPTFLEAHLSSAIQIKDQMNFVIDCVKESIVKLVAKLYAREDIDTYFSGCTLCLLLISSTNVFVFNIGDSRCLQILPKVFSEKIGSHSKIGKSQTTFHLPWFMQLSEDQKPDSPVEFARITKCGGEVSCSVDSSGLPNGPQRVWIPGQEYPGLAMSRSIGDRVGEKVGVTWKPTYLVRALEAGAEEGEVAQTAMGETSDRENPKKLVKVLKSKRKFHNGSLDLTAPKFFGQSDGKQKVSGSIFVVATDGVWDVISNEDLVRFLVPFYELRKIEEACDSLLEFLVEKWKHLNVEVIDDVTFLIVFAY